MKKVAILSLALFMGAASLSGCMSTRAGQGAFIGGATGAVAGAVATGKAGGAAVGGAIGAAVGWFIGKNSYRCQKTNIFGQTYTGWCWR